jgi:hypothetical protein
MVMLRSRGALVAAPMLGNRMRSLLSTLRLSARKQAVVDGRSGGREASLADGLGSSALSVRNRDKLLALPGQKRRMAPMG